MSTTTTLSGAQRKYLRGLAHSLKPVVMLGKAGLSEGFYAQLEAALDSHELVKVRFVDHQDQKAAAAAEIDAHLSCQMVGKIGHVVTFFRPSTDSDKRQIAFP